ncbi:unnamed protein product [Pleuronectes platessa]|uniref:Uncharacterized protein n=1 Tax=Pleuronectes platessa TaxID=8262 RepID=A0A9N7VKZ5_PLEPL|nr:unnamed protein product [Pleuronectes platessa]
MRERTWRPHLARTDTDEERLLAQLIADANVSSEVPLPDLPPRDSVLAQICWQSRESPTGTAAVAERRCASMCLCECLYVWGQAEWETSILFGHTAESHSPTLTVWNGLLDSRRLSYHDAEASLFNHSFSLHHFAISQGALGSPGSQDSQLINIELFISCF